jgi:hypothetical protein
MHSELIPGSAQELMKIEKGLLCYVLPEHILLQIDIGSSQCLPDEINMAALKNLKSKPADILQRSTTIKEKADIVLYLDLIEV